MINLVKQMYESERLIVYIHFQANLSMKNAVTIYRIYREISFYSFVHISYFRIMKRLFGNYDLHSSTMVLFLDNYSFR